MRPIALVLVLVALGCGSSEEGGSETDGGTGSASGPTASGASASGSEGASGGVDESGGASDRTIRLLSLDGDRGCIALDSPDEVACWPTVQGADPAPLASVVGLPAPVDRLTGGDGHTCVLVEGAVWCWGNNSDGQLGHEGETTDVPQAVAGLPTPAVDVSAGLRRTCAIGNGQVWCWGDRYPFHPSSATPVLVEGLPPGATAVATGGLHQCAVVDDTVHCWGDNDAGQLGDGTTDSREAPEPVIGLPGGIVQIDAGSSHTCVLAGDQVWCWGANDRMQVDESLFEDAVTMPIVRADLAEAVTTIGMQTTGSCALTAAATWCWGDATGSTIYLREMTEAAGATLLAAGNSGACALVDQIVCWGAYLPPLLDPPEPGTTGESGGGTDDPYGPCTDASQCPIPGSNCAASTGACQPPCDASACPQPTTPGFAATCESGRCSIPCSLDSPCPPDMVCLAAVVCGWP